MCGHAPIAIRTCAIAIVYYSSPPNRSANAELVTCWCKIGNFFVFRICWTDLIVHYTQVLNAFDSLGCADCVTEVEFEVEDVKGHYREVIMDGMSQFIFLNVVVSISCDHNLFFGFTSRV